MEGRGLFGDVEEGTDMEGFGTIKAHEGDLIVMRRQPLQTGLLKIPKLGIRKQRSWDGWKEFLLKAQRKVVL